MFPEVRSEPVIFKVLLSAIKSRLKSGHLTRVLGPHLTTGTRCVGAQHLFSSPLVWLPGQLNAFQVANASALAVGKMPTQLNIGYDDTGRDRGLPGSTQGAGIGEQGGGDARRPGGSGGWATFSTAASLAPALLAHIAS